MTQPQAPQTPGQPACTQVPAPVSPPVPPPLPSVPASPPAQVPPIHIQLQMPPEAFPPAKPAKKERDNSLLIIGCVLIGLLAFIGWQLTLQKGHISDVPNQPRSEQNHRNSTPVVSFEGWQQQVKAAEAHVHVEGEANFQSIVKGFTDEKRHPQYGGVLYLLVQLPSDSGPRFWASDRQPPIAIPQGYSRWVKDPGTQGSWMVVK